MDEKASIERRRNNPAWERWKEHCQAMGARFKGYRKKAHTNPPDFEAFLQQGGGMRKIEYAAGAKAAEEAIKFEREWWLPKLEGWLEIYGDDEFLRGFLEHEIKRLRRCLGIRKERSRSRSAVHKSVSASANTAPAGATNKPEGLLRDAASRTPRRLLELVLELGEPVRIADAQRQLRDLVQHGAHHRPSSSATARSFCRFTSRSAHSSGSASSFAFSERIRNALCFVTCEREISSLRIVRSFASCSRCRALSASMRFRFHSASSSARSCSLLDCLRSGAFPSRPMYL